MGKYNINDLHNADQRKALECIGKIFNGEYPFTWEQYKKCGILIFAYLKRKAGRSKVYRASFIPDNDDRINLKSRYSYPPKCITEMGRCNLKGHPVFYCTPSFLGAIQEAILTKKTPNVIGEFNNIIYISEWEMSMTKEFSVYDTNHNLALKSKFDSEEEAFNAIYQNFINQIFTSSKGHDISANLSFILMNGTKQSNKEPDKLYPPLDMENIKIISYPSVVKGGKFLNLAIHPSVIDDNDLVFNRVFKVGLPYIDFDILTNFTPLPIEYLKIGTLVSKEGNEITWREPVYSDYSNIDK